MIYVILFVIGIDLLLKSTFKLLINDQYQLSGIKRTPGLYSGYSLYLRTLKLTDLLPAYAGIKLNITPRAPGVICVINIRKYPFFSLFSRLDDSMRRYKVSLVLAHI